MTDSACDLTPEMAEERGVCVVPLRIRFGDEEFIDRTELSGKEFWDRVVTGPHVPETAAPSPGSFQQVFEEAADQGAEGVVCICISSRLSATYQAACTATEGLEKRVPVQVFDTLSVTMGEGLMVLAATDMAEAGTGLDDIVTSLESLRARTSVYGVLGALDHLKRGGRIGGAAHLVGSLLSIKPVIEVRDGLVEVESKQRTRARSLNYLAEKALRAGHLERLAVVGGAADDLGDLLDQVSEVSPDHPMVVSELGPVVGSHAGPGTVGLAFEVAT
ncbi:MAG TPA: DegV family protein [Acidimicrobiales bacterium]|nr:DegV family protein [Acidimicrobiales bacterium]